MSRILPPDSFPARVQTIIKKLGSQEKLGDSCGISGVTIGKYALGKAEPSRERLIAMANAADVNVLWLATGEGPMKRGEWPEGKTAGPLSPFVGMGPGGGTKYPLGDDLREAGYVHVPRFDIAASAGGGAVVHSEQVVDYLAFRTEWVKDSLRVDPCNLALIRVTGDSMEPTMGDGDLVLVDHSKCSISANAIYVVQFMGDLLVKRIHAHLDGSVSIISDNKIYDPEIIMGEHLSRLKVIGRVVWYGRRV